MPSDRFHILLVNPWIHDFAAYDVWAKPLGLLTLGAILRQWGCKVSYIDCLDRFHPRTPRTDPAVRYGRGPYRKRPIPPPKGLEDVPRTFSRYGIEPAWFLEELAAVSRPDLILVTSLMTYWHPGVRETIGAVRKVHARVPIVLGGIYATLYPDHARRHAGADRVTVGSGIRQIAELLAEFAVTPSAPFLDPNDLDAHPYPAFDLQRVIGYIPLLTTVGCPFRCDYCAAGYLNPEWLRRSPDAVLEEIRHWHGNAAVTDFVIYDDAFLVDSDHHAVPLLEGLLQAGLGIRFHTPNAVHVREINPRIASLMFAAGFRTVRLGLETAGSGDRPRHDVKVTTAEFKRAVAALLSVGFDRSQVGAYLLFGLPGQSLSDLAASIRFVHGCGITPIPAYYTPIPHTALWQTAVAASRYDLEADPVFCNNAVLPCLKDPFSWHTMREIRRMTAAAV